MKPGSWPNAALFGGTGPRYSTYRAGRHGRRDWVDRQDRDYVDGLLATARRHGIVWANRYAPPKQEES